MSDIIKTFRDKFPKTLYLSWVPTNHWDFGPAKGLNRPAHNCHMTVAFGKAAINAALEDIVKGELDPRETKIHIVGYGNDCRNEGFLTSFITANGRKTPSNPANWLENNGGVPHITVGVASNSTAKATAQVPFLPFLNKFMKGWNKHPIINLSEARKGTQNFQKDTQVERPRWIPEEISGSIMACTADGRFIPVNWTELINSSKANSQTELTSVISGMIKRATNNIKDYISSEIKRRYSEQYSDLLLQYNTAIAAYEEAVKTGDKFVLKYSIFSEPYKADEEYYEYATAIAALNAAIEDIENGIYSFENEDKDNARLIVYQNGKEIIKPVKPVNPFCYYATQEDIKTYIKNNYNKVYETLKAEVSKTLERYCLKRNIEVPEFEIPEIL